MLSTGEHRKPLESDVKEEPKTEYPLDREIKVEPGLLDPDETVHVPDLVNILEKSKTKGVELEKHRNTVREILLGSNATPIQSHSTSGYACCFCTKKFPNPSDLKSHNHTAHDASAKSIFMKGKDFSKFHVKLDVTALACTICGRSIKTVDELFDHLTQSHNKNLYVNTKNFIVPFSFSEKSLKCIVCKNSFHNFRVLVEHMNIHFRNYICVECNVGFVSQNVLFQHARTHKTGTFKCGHCDKVFQTLMKKRAHERVVHTHTNALHKCNYCSQGFKDYWQREKHFAAVHGIVSEYKCTACDKVFAHQKGLRIHTKRDHLMERPHACTECDKKFFDGKKLKEHMVKHTGTKEFECDVCKKRYGRRKTLNQHMRVHDDYCRFRCARCNQGFVQRASWVGHMRTKHNEIF